MIDSVSVLSGGGFVKLVDYMGSDSRILEAARVSTGSKPSKGSEKDKALIRFLYKNEHTSPFEKAVFEFHVRAPIFVVRQWMRHRMQSYNEYSGRYSKIKYDFYVPSEWRMQADWNHQCSGQSIPEDIDKEVSELYFKACKKQFDLYEKLIEKGISKEMARCVLPVSTFTEFYTTVNLWNLFRFINLRSSKHAQYEIRVYANAILSILESIKKFEYSVEIFKEMGLVQNAFRSLLNRRDDFNMMKDAIDEL